MNQHELKMDENLPHNTTTNPKIEDLGTKENNFLQVEKMIECRNCKPEKYETHYDNCHCVCHSSTNKMICHVCNKSLCGAIISSVGGFKHVECEKYCVHEKPLNICEDCNKPMGVSAWKRHGLKYKYWDFFRNEIIKEMEKLLNSLKKKDHLSQCNIKERNPETCGWCLIGNSQYNNVINDILNKLK